jgi:hypothetical protein
MATNSPTISRIDSTTTAFFNDVWSGPVEAFVAPFRTKRKGATVTRYRWQRQDGQHCCSSVFTSLEQAVAAKRRDARFSFTA